MNSIQTDIETRLAALEPMVEVILAEKVSAGLVRVFIDHPAGVNVALCERVTHQLRDLLGGCALEVSSPGPRRPLTKPAHFRRFVGRRARVSTRLPRGDRCSFTGELVAASEAEVTVAAESGIVSIPYPEIKRSNLLEG